MNFDELCQTWQNQDQKTNLASSQAIIDKAKAQTTAFKKKQLITIAVLSITFIVLLAFYFWVEAYKNFTQSLGLVIMISVLFLRIALEIMSQNKLQKLDTTLNFEHFVLNLNRFFKRRKWINFVLSPIVYLLYIGGFISMLPVFKENLSAGFYLYVLVSGVIIFIALAIFIAYHIKKENDSLKFLQNLVGE